MATGRPCGGAPPGVLHARELKCVFFIMQGPVVGDLLFSAIVTVDAGSRGPISRVGT